MIRSVQAHSSRPTEAAGQVKFNFDGGNTAGLLPRCGLISTSANVHLAVYGDANGVGCRPLCWKPRFLLPKSTTVSIPVAAFTASLFAVLEVTRRIPRGTAATTAVMSPRHWSQDCRAFSRRELSPQSSYGPSIWASTRTRRCQSRAAWLARDRVKVPSRRLRSQSSRPDSR